MSSLNCENIDSTYLSVSNITNIGIDDIRDFIANFKCAETDKRLNNYTIKHIILEDFKKKFKLKSIRYKSAYFFHFTRTYRSNKYKEGLLPTHLAINKLFGYLYKIGNFKKKDFTVLKKSVLEHHEIKKKLKETGPWAMIIRDACFESDRIGNVDYLKVPEIVEDMCRISLGYDVLERYKLKTYPCIVKFKVDLDYNMCERYFEAVLYYLHYDYLHKTMNSNCSDNYSTDGIISHSKIESIEFLNTIEIKRYESSVKRRIRMQKPEVENKFNINIILKR